MPECIIRTCFYQLCLLFGSTRYHIHYEFTTDNSYQKIIFTILLFIVKLALHMY